MASRIVSEEGRSTDDTRRDEDPARRLVGRVLQDRYAVLDVLGRGGMGVVYAGMDCTLDRPVVIKVVLPEQLHASAGRRLIREAKLLCRVHHPSIVTVLDLGLLETGEPFLVMERLEGEDLCRILAAEGSLTLEQVVALLTPVADALETLHAAGVVHRDVKPENLFVLDAVTDGPPRVKIIDFGIALLDETTVQRFTRTGQLVGTPDYIAPECVRGARPTAKSDVYALATTAYELLTGRIPFDADGLDLLLLKSQTDAPSLAIHLPGCSARLAGVFDAALSRDPDARPSANAFVRQLREVVAFEATRGSGTRTRIGGARRGIAV